MSHASKADKLLIKPAAGARPAPPRARGQFIPKARTRRPVTRRVTRGTATTRLATAPDRQLGESYRPQTGSSQAVRTGCKDLHVAERAIQVRPARDEDRLPMADVFATVAE